MADEISIVARLEIGAKTGAYRVAGAGHTGRAYHQGSAAPEGHKRVGRVTNCGACQTSSGIHPGEAERADHMSNIESSDRPA